MTEITNMSEYAGDPAMYTTVGYVIYLLLSIALTVWVARTLHRNGRIFLVDAFGGREALADSVNHLLVVGFHLINIGYVTLSLKGNDHPLNTQQVIEVLSTKIGWVLVVLGLMHFGNLYVFNRLRQGAETKHVLGPEEIVKLDPA